MSDPDVRPRMHPAVLATAIALPIALVVGVVVAAVIATRTPARDPVAVGAVDSPRASSAECTGFVGALPSSFGDWTRGVLAEPAPPAAAAWQSDRPDPIVARCGLARPAEFVQDSTLTVVDGVQWFEVSGAAQGIDASTWFAVDRTVYIGVTIPGGSGPTPLQSISSAITKTLPAVPIDPGPVR